MDSALTRIIEMIMFLELAKKPISIAKRIRIGLICLLVSFAVHSQPASSKSINKYLPGIHALSTKDLLKNWALSTCLSLAAKDISDRNDAAFSAGLYARQEYQPAAVLSPLENLAKIYVAKQYSDGITDTEYNTLKCIDLYNSKTLDELAAAMATIRPGRFKEAIDPVENPQFNEIKRKWPDLFPENPRGR